MASVERTALYSAELGEEDPALLDSSEERPAASRFALKRGRLAVAALCLVGCAFALGYTHLPASHAAATDADKLVSFYSTLNIDPDNIDINKLNLSASGLPKDVIRDLSTTVVTTRRRRPGHSHIRQLRIATCVVDAAQGTWYLERAALAITAATASCKKGNYNEDTSPQVKAACAADISGVLAAFSFVAEYISEAVSMCSDTVNLRAQCAADVSGVVANTARIANQAATVAATCRSTNYDEPIDDSVWQGTRRLVENTINPTYDVAKMRLATCVLDATQATTFLAFFGAAVDAATHTCDTNGGGRQTRDGRILCAAGVMDILESVFMASSFISSAVSHCAPKTNEQAICVQGALGLAGGLSGLTKNGLNIVNSCEKIPPAPLQGN